MTVTATLGGSVTLSSATEVTVSVGGGTATSGTDYTAVADFKLTIAATESTGTGTFTLTPTQDSVSEGDETIDVTGTASDFTVTKAEMTLTDDETAPTAIALTTAPTSVGEDDSATEVTVTATLGGSVTLSSATEVTVSVGGGTATSGTDYTAVADFKLTIAATESTGTGTFMLTPTQDSISEDDETIDVTGAASGFTVTKAEMTLTDDETAPGTIALTTAPTSVREDDSATEVTVTATLDGSVTLSSVTEVTVSVGGGSATSGTDYTAVENFKLTIAATESTGTGTFTLTPTQDSVFEDDETIDVTGAAGDFTVTKAEMTLTDDETAPTAIALTTAPTSVREDDSATEVTVTATLGGSVTLAGATEVTVSVGGGTATSGTDYTAVENFKLTIAATESSGTGTFTLTPTQDSISEDDETIDVTGTAGGFTVTKAEMTLTDDETAPGTIALTTAPSSVREDDSATEVTVTATLGGSVTLASATEVTVSVGGGTATSGTDYTAVADFKLTIAATESTGTGTFMLTPTQDSISEDDETIDITGTAGDFTVTQATMTLNDDEPALTVAFAEDLYTVVEGATVEVEVTLSRNPGSTVTIPVTATAGAGVAESDYTGVPASVAFDSGETGKSFTVTAHQDRVAEANETVTLGFGPLPEGVSEGSRASTQVSIADDDTRRVAVAPTELELPEGESGRYTVVLESQPTGAVTVTVAAPAEAQFTVDAPALTFTPESWETARTVTVTAAVDANAEAPQPPPATLTHAVSGADYEGVAADSVTVSILEAVAAMDHELTLAVAPAEVAESAGSTTITVTGTLTTVLSHEVAVTVAVTGETAAATDFAAAAPVTLTIAAGHSIGTASFTLAPVDDELDEADETVTVSGTTPLADLTITPASLTIGDDDERGVTVQPTELTLRPGGHKTYTVRLDSEPTATAMIEVLVPAAGDLEVMVQPTTLTFTPAEWMTPQTVEVTASRARGAVTTSVRLDLEHAVSGGDYDQLPAEPVALSIAYDSPSPTPPHVPPPPPVPPDVPSDGVPVVSIAADVAAVEEGVPASFTVTRSGEAASPLTVRVQVTERGSFIAGTPPSEVTIAANERAATLPVANEDDATDEPDGAVTATLAAGAGYVLGSAASATVTVTDNDAAPELTIADVRALESAGAIEFTVRLAAASGHQVTVTCTSADGTATAEEDYEPERGTLTLAPGQTGGTIRLAVLDDTMDEADETFAMVLADPVNATLDDDTATGTIVDDDAPVVPGWLARFGRTAATHVAEAIDQRLAETGRLGARAAVAGRALEAAADVAQLDGDETVPFRSLQFHELLASSSFQIALTGADAPDGAGGQWTAWGRGEMTHLAGVEGDLSLAGDIASGVVGADHDWGSVLAGLSVAYTGGAGGFTVRGTGRRNERNGDLGSWLLSAHPYVSVAITDRLSVWGLLGYGVGRMSLAEGAAAAETDISMAMGAFAGRGVLLAPEQTGGVALAMKSDGFVLRIASAAAHRLSAVEADVQRVRLVLEGSVDALSGPAGVLRPSLQVGARYDGGAAETGAGLEVGGGLRYGYPPWGLTVAANGRLLVTHQDRGFEEWGVGGSIRLNPAADGRGLSVGVNTAWGEQASGVERLWSHGAARPAGVAAHDSAALARQLEAEVSYGMDAPGGRGLVTPYAGVTLADGGAHAYRLGSRLSVGQSFSLDLEADRRESAGAAPKHSLKLSGTLRW